MAVIALAVKHMLAAGMDHAAIIAAVEEMEAHGAPQRSARQERNRRYYEGKKASEKRLKTSETSYSDAKGTLDKEGFPHTPSEEINPPKEKTPKGVQKKSPRAFLEAVLSPTQAGAVLEHRQRIRKPLTERAAELLSARFARAPEVGFTPDQAADLMISRGWQSFELDWAKNAAPPVVKALSTAGTDEAWMRRLKFARLQRVWSVEEFGPMPGAQGCRVPAHLLEPSDGQGWREQSFQQPKRSVA
ncbi:MULTISPECIES: hypothetical protein [unclassified Sinorhizobium]|uniref:hypothetical protein n=1 Tax=unclassified Sinorhizobium TaxID=2613772 RepID=UPI00352412A9